MIEVQQLSKRFSSGRGRARRVVTAVDGVDFTAADGRITGLLGPNGAGKTTTLRIAAALLKPDAGRVLVDGIEVAAEPTRALARMGMLSDARGLYPRLTARENIVYFGKLHGMDSQAAAQRAALLAEVLDMKPLLDRRTEGFSQGERMKTALARALVHDPANIVLDEPTNGLDVLATRALRDTLRRLRDEHGKCIVFSTHIMQEVERLCDHVVVVSQGRTVASGSVPQLMAPGRLRRLRRDLRQAGFRAAAGDGSHGRSHSMIGAAWSVYGKELLDALRDRRTLLMVLISSVAIGPLVLILVSTLVGAIEKRAEARELVVQGIEYAPTLRNFLERQTYTLKAAPEDYQRALSDSKLGDPVLVVPASFEADLARGEPPVLELFSSAANRRAQSGVGAVLRLLRAFNQEQAVLRLAVRGVAASSLEVLRVEERDLADPATRAAQLATMVPFFVIMAVLYGALNAALDTTAGERERGSLEPLLMNPASPLALVLGKWGAVVSVSMLIALLSCMSFLPGQWLLRSEALAAMFRFGVGEALLFVALLLPLAGALSAVLMAIAIRCKSFKEAQANTTVVLLVVSMLPLVTVFNQEGDSPWHLWVPALAQTTLMGRVLKGEALAWPDVGLTVFVSVVLATAALAFVARTLRSAALK